MSWIARDGARLYYEVHGSGPAVLFVHGSGGHHAAWWQQVAALRGDYTVITLDLRGFGCSRWDAEHDSAAFPGDIRAVLDAVAEAGGPQQAVLVGQSIGPRPRCGPRWTGRTGRPGWCWPTRWAASGTRSWPGWSRRTAPPPRRCRCWTGCSPPRSGPSTRTGRSCSSRWARSTRPRWPTCATWAATDPSLDELNAVPFPVLLLAGEQDSVLSTATVRRAGELLPRAQVEIVPGAPHSMYWETPALFNDAVGRFLADVYAARGTLLG